MNTEDLKTKAREDLKLHKDSPFFEGLVNAWVIGYQAREIELIKQTTKDPVWKQ